MLKRLKLITAVLCSFGIISLVPASVGTASAETSCPAMLVGSMGSYAQWSTSTSATYPPLSGSQLATITGDGQYTVSFSLSSGTESVSSIDFLCLQIDNMTTDNYPSLAVTVDSVSIDGNAIEYKTSPENINLSYYVQGEPYSRIYLSVTSGWGAIAATEDVPSNTTVTDNISVTFTVSGTGSGPIETTKATTEAPTNASGSQDTTTTLVSGSTEQTSTTAQSSSVDNSTTGESNGIIGVTAAGILAACIAVISAKKRR
jgi:hypothetical protein